MLRIRSRLLAGRDARCFASFAFSFSTPELFDRDLFDPARMPESTAAVPNADRWEILFRGFYPRIHDRNLSPREWLGDYFRTYVERNLSEVLAVSDLRAFEHFVRLAAASTAMELNLSRLAGDIGVGQQTARRWLNVLEIGYLAVTLPPHYANFRKRLRKRPRLHFLDIGLVCYLLDIRMPTRWRDTRFGERSSSRSSSLNSSRVSPIAAARRRSTIGAMRLAERSMR